MFFERPDSGEVAILVHIAIDSGSVREDPNEFEELASSAGALSVDVIRGSRKQPSPTYFVGAGKLEEIADAVLFFASDMSNYITGQVLSVSGGLTMAD